MKARKSVYMFVVGLVRWLLDGCVGKASSFLEVLHLSTLSPTLSVHFDCIDGFAVTNLQEN